MRHGFGLKCRCVCYIAVYGGNRRSPAVKCVGEIGILSSFGCCAVVGRDRAGLNLLVCFQNRAVPVCPCYGTGSQKNRFENRIGSRHLKSVLCLVCAVLRELDLAVI